MFNLEMNEGAARVAKQDAAPSIPQIAEIRNVPYFPSIREGMQLLFLILQIIQYRTWSRRIKVGVFVDSENISYRYLPFVMWVARLIGIVVFAKCYCSEALAGTKNITKYSKENGMDIYPVKIRKDKKNDVDLEMSSHIVDQAGFGEIDLFFVVSSDSDFISAITRVRERGKKVLGAGMSFTNDDHINSCHAFIPLDKYK